MRSEAAPKVDFMDWYDSLSDEEQCAVEKRLRDAADHLGIFVPELSFITYDFLDFRTDFMPKISVN